MSKFNVYLDSESYWRELMEYFSAFDPKRIALSGGSSANILDKILELNGSDDRSFYQVDDRYVKRDNEDSNWKLIESKIERLKDRGIERLKGFDTSLEIKKCVQCYSEELELDEEGYLFDMTILGVGPDGHVASLFPLESRPDGVDQIVFESENGFVAQTQTDSFAVLDRMSLTYEAIEKSKHVLLLLWGENKKPILEMMEKGGDLPVHQILKMPQSHVWFWS